MRAKNFLDITSGLPTHKLKYIYINLKKLFRNLRIFLQKIENLRVKSRMFTANLNFDKSSSNKSLKGFLISNSTLDGLFSGTNQSSTIYRSAKID